MTIRPHQGQPEFEARVAAWLRTLSPEPPPVDVLESIVTVTARLRANPGWLARWRGHHLAGARRRADRGPWLLPVVATLILGASVAGAVLVVGRPIDEQPFIVVVPSGSPAATLRETGLRTPTPAATTAPWELVPYTNEEDGYSLLLPAAWRDTARRAIQGADSSFPGVMEFGYPRAGDGPALRISVGRPDGTIYLCDGMCHPVTVRTLDAFEAELVSTPRFFRPDDRLVGLDRLGNDTARTEEAAITHNCLGCPEARYHVFAIHDGRPIVLAFNYWNVAWSALGGDHDGSFSGTALRDVKASLRFTGTEEPSLVPASALP